ncbi:hypothetical protein R1flu_026396 [Riccia fluitans]|uniref:Uncharacterized protein n=1 Tax=Riccia fluitans TaxID=41844 RepID=A0ABD1XFU3_9MARC
MLVRLSTDDIRRPGTGCGYYSPCTLWESTVLTGLRLPDRHVVNDGWWRLSAHSDVSAVDQMGRVRQLVPQRVNRANVEKKWLLWPSGVPAEGG